MEAEDCPRLTDSTVVSLSWPPSPSILEFFPSVENSFSELTVDMVDRRPQLNLTTARHAVLHNPTFQQEIRTSPRQLDDVSPVEKVRDATPPRGRERTRVMPGHSGACASGISVSKKRDAKPEASIWEEALSRAVGAVAKVDVDARAPKLDKR